VASDIAFDLAVMNHFCPAVIFVAIRPIELGRIVVDGVEVALVRLGKRVDNAQRTPAADKAAHHDRSSIRNEIDGLLRGDDLVSHRNPPVINEPCTAFAVYGKKGVWFLPTPLYFTPDDI